MNLIFNNKWFQIFILIFSQELFSFISEKRKFKLIKNNVHLNKKLDISIIDYKKYFFQKKNEYYGYISKRLLWRIKKVFKWYNIKWRRINRFIIIWFIQKWIF